MSKQFYHLPTMLALALRQRGVLVTKVLESDVHFTISEQITGVVIARTVIQLTFYSGDDVWTHTIHTKSMDETIDQLEKLNRELKTATSPPKGFRKEI